MNLFERYKEEIERMIIEPEKKPLVVFELSRKPSSDLIREIWKIEEQEAIMKIRREPDRN